MNNKSLLAVVVILLMGIVTIIGLGTPPSAKGLLPEFTSAGQTQADSVISTSQNN